MSRYISKTVQDWDMVSYNGSLIGTLNHMCSNEWCYFQLT